jgi:hypothetical protein
MLTTEQTQSPQKCLLGSFASAFAPKGSEIVLTSGITPRHFWSCGNYKNRHFCERCVRRVCAMYVNSAPILEVLYHKSLENKIREILNEVFRYARGDFILFSMFVPLRWHHEVIEIFIEFASDILERACGLFPDCVILVSRDLNIASTLCDKKWNFDLRNE